MTKKTRPIEPLLNTDQVAEWLGVTPQTVRKSVYDGRLRRVAGIRNMRFRREDVEAFIEANTTGGRK